MPAHKEQKHWSGNIKEQNISNQFEKVSGITFEEKDIIHKKEWTSKVL